MVLAWVWAALLVVATVVAGMVFPELRPRYLEEQTVAAGEEQRAQE